MEEVEEELSGKRLYVFIGNILYKFVDKCCRLIGLFFVRGKSVKKFNFLKSLVNIVSI